MRHFIRRTTHKVVAVQRAAKTASKSRTPKSKAPRSSLLGARRIKTYHRPRVSHDLLPGDVSRKHSRELLSRDSQDSDVDIGLPHGKHIRQPRPTRKRALGDLGGDSNKGSDSEYVIVRVQEELKD
jgi:hypothetical protein